MKQTVDSHIVTLLQDHDCVIIPDFGGLIAQYTPVRIHPVRNSMAPPAKRIAFNEKLQQNDGHLVSHISLKEELSGADAALRIKLFVNTVNLALDQHQRYQLHSIGLFRKEPGQPVTFEFEEKINLLADSFGLPEVFSKPIQRHRSLSEIRTAVNEKVAPRLQPEEGAKTISIWRKSLRYAALLPIVALSASALYLAGLDTGLEMSTLNPISYVWQERSSVVTNPESQVATQKLTDTERAEFYAALGFAATPEAPTATYLTDQYLPAQTAQEFATPSELEQVSAETEPTDGGWEVTQAAPVAEVQPEQEPAKETAVSDGFAGVKIIKEQTGRFYIIAGGFIEEANATQLQNRAEKNGLEAKIIEPTKGSRLHRVSLADYDNREEALARITELTPTYGKALWVLEY